MNIFDKIKDEMIAAGASQHPKSPDTHILRLGYAEFQHWDGHKFRPTVELHWKGTVIGQADIRTNEGVNMAQLLWTLFRQLTGIDQVVFVPCYGPQLPDGAPRAYVKQFRLGSLVFKNGTVDTEDALDNDSGARSFYASGAEALAAARRPIGDSE